MGDSTLTTGYGAFVAEREPKAGAFLQDKHLSQSYSGSDSRFFKDMNYRDEIIIIIIFAPVGVTSCPPPWLTRRN